MEPRQIALVRTNFDEIIETDESIDALARTFYVKLFGSDPQLLQLFPPVMEMQRERFMAALQYVVDNLDVPTQVEKFLGQLARDHRKYGVEPDHYITAGRALHTALAEYNGPYYWNPELSDAWFEVVALMSTAMAVGAAEDPLPPAWQATVLGNHRILDDVALIRLQADLPIPYAAGQYLPVQIPQCPRMWRYLSPSIPPNAHGELEFHIRKIRGGWLSPAIIGQTGPGDVWTFGAPLGGLHVDLDSGDDVLMIACGTGIAPMRAQIMELAQRGNNPRVHLFVGGHHPCDLYDAANMWQLSLSNPWLTVVPVAESPDEPWWYTGPPTELPDGMHHTMIGRIGDVVASFGSWADRQIQIAGSADMIADTRLALIQGGTPEYRIQFDPVPEID